MIFVLWALHEKAMDSIPDRYDQFGKLTFLNGSAPGVPGKAPK